MAGMAAEVPEESGFFAGRPRCTAGARPQGFFLACDLRPPKEEAAFFVWRRGQGGRPHGRGVSGRIGAARIGFLQMDIPSHISSGKWKTVEWENSKMRKSRGGTSASGSPRKGWAERWADGC